MSPRGHLAGLFLFLHALVAGIHHHGREQQPAFQINVDKTYNMSKQNEGKRGKDQRHRGIVRQDKCGDEEKSVLEYLIITLQKPPGGK